MDAKEIALKSPVFSPGQDFGRSESTRQEAVKTGGGPVTYAFRVKNQEAKLIAEGVSTCLFAGKTSGEYFFCSGSPQ